METTLVYWGYIRDNEKENGNYYNGFRVKGFRGLGFRVWGFRD